MLRLLGTAVYGTLFATDMDQEVALVAPPSSDSCCLSNSVYVALRPVTVDSVMVDRPIG